MGLLSKQREDEGHDRLERHGDRRVDGRDLQRLQRLGIVQQSPVLVKPDPFRGV